MSVRHGYQNWMCEAKEEAVKDKSTIAQKKAWGRRRLVNCAPLYFNKMILGPGMPIPPNYT